MRLPMFSRITKRFILVLLFLLTLSSVVEAQDISLNIDELKLTTKCAPEVESNRRALISNEEASGIWFQMPVALCIVDRLATMPALLERIKLLEHRRDSADELILIQQNMINLSIDAQKEAEIALKTSVKQKRELEEKLNSWEHSPLLWFGIGALAVAAIGGSFIFTLYPPSR